MNIIVVTDSLKPVRSCMTISPPNALMISDKTAFTAVSGVSSTVPTFGCLERNTCRGGGRDNYQIKVGKDIG